MLDGEGARGVYSTGGLAEACGVSVRTVQYYDEKGLLPPSGTTDGGRRLYTADDAARLRKILLLKSLGLKLAAIRGVLDSNVSAQVMADILAEQDRKLEAEVAQRQQAREFIARMARGLAEQGELPAESIAGMEDIMQDDKIQVERLHKVYGTMLGLALPVGVMEVAALAHWIRKGNWKPYAAVEAFALPLAVGLVRFYRENVAYQCPHCHAVFQPEAREWFFAPHTPTTRKVKCTSCGAADWCAEVSAGRMQA